MKYALENKEWKEISPLMNAKPHQSTSVFNDVIYCFGIPESKKINVEKYDIVKNEWE